MMQLIHVDTNVIHLSTEFVGDQSEAKCLLYTFQEGQLKTKGVNCESKYKPLCLQLLPQTTPTVSEVLEECDKCAEDTNQCNNWVDLQNYPVDGITITGAELCLDPCVKNVNYNDYVNGACEFGKLY